MKPSKREEVLAALRELEAENAGEVMPAGDFYAHVDLMLVVTYMGRMPVEYSAEGYVSSDRVEDLQPSVRSMYSKMADTNTVFQALNPECRKTEEGNNGERGEFDSEKEDYEKGLD